MTTNKLHVYLGSDIQRNESRIEKTQLHLISMTG